jgi:peptidoglycan L-alanyl-D-glutamate endopeptidase CwlK
MPKLGKRSLSRLNGVDPRLSSLCHAVVKDFDITVLEGLRTLDTQKKYYEDGKTKTLNSKHLKGMAVDIAPYPVDWENDARFYYLAGMMKAYAYAMGFKIRWGGDWDSDNRFGSRGKYKGKEKFKDLVHFEIL